MTPEHPTAQEPPYAWVVVWACFGSLAVIFGVAYSFAAFFESSRGSSMRSAPMCRWCSACAA